MEKIARKLRSQATEEEAAQFASMEQEELLKMLKEKSEAEIDRTGVYLQKDEISDDEEEDEDSGAEDEESKGSPAKKSKNKDEEHPHAKIMADEYSAEEQQEDLMLYKIDWELAHNEAFGDFDLDAVNTNVAQVDANKIMIEPEDLDDRLREQESQFLEK